MNLFKLKKDGKTVGYLRFAEYSDKDLHIQLSVEGDEWDDDSELVEYNEILPYVCDDKNGEKVFAGDKVKGEGIGEPDDIGIVGYSKKGFYEIDIGWELSSYKWLELVK